MEYVWVILLTVIVLGVSLYNFFDSRDLNQLTSSVHNNQVFEHRNKRYGAYSIRKSYNRVMLFIVGGVVVAFGATMGTHYTFGAGSGIPPIARQQEIFDTTLLSLATPPEEQEKTLPPTYSIKSNSGSGGQNQADQQSQEETPKSTVTPQDPNQPKNTTGETTPPKTETPATVKTHNYESRDPEDYRNAGSDAVAQAQQRAADRKKREEEKKRQDELRRQGNNTNGSNGREGSAPKNQPMVDWDMNGRNPYANEVSNIKNPGYTCGKGEGGTVVVKVKVNSNGNVISAEPIGNLDGVDYCLRQRSVEYALKSRFEPSSKVIQEGTITYKFKPQ